MGGEMMRDFKANPLTAEEALLWSLEIWSKLAHSGERKKIIKPLDDYFDCPLCMFAGRRPQWRIPDCKCLVWGKCGEDPACYKTGSAFYSWVNSPWSEGRKHGAWMVFDNILEAYEKEVRRLNRVKAR
jgi:hypothetical protein